MMIHIQTMTECDEEDHWRCARTHTQHTHKQAHTTLLCCTHAAHELHRQHAAKCDTPLVRRRMSALARSDLSILECAASAGQKLRALETASSQNEVFQAAVEQLHLGAFSAFDSVPVPIASFAALAPLPLTSLSRYARIKAMLLNAAAGSAASAMTELAFETALAAKHLQVRLMALPLVFCPSF